MPDPREARRHLEVRREQARTDAGQTARSSPPACARCRPSPGTTTRSTSSMNNRDQLDVFWPEQLHREGQRRAAGRADVSRGPGIELRLAVLLLRLRSEEECPQPRVRRRRQEGGPLRDVHAAGRGVPRALGAGGRDVLHAARSSRRSTRAARSSRSTDRGTARPTPQDGYNVTFQPFAGGKPSGAFEVFAQRIRRQGAADEPERRRRRAPTASRRRRTVRSTSATARRAKSGASCTRNRHRIIWSSGHLVTGHRCQIGKFIN